MIVIRDCYISDIENILKIQKLCYPEYLHETGNVFLSILELSRFCYILEFNNQVIGYLMAHLWNSIEEPPTLHDKLPFSYGDYCFIHDIVIHPDYQKKGYASQLLNHLYKNIEFIKQISIVAVNKALLFWKKQGFNIKDIELDKLKTYGSGSYFMVK